MWCISDKKRGSLLILVISLLSVISWSIFTVSFIIQKEFKKKSLEKQFEKRVEKEEISKIFIKLYTNYIEEEIGKNSDLEDRIDYLLFFNGKNIIENNFGDKEVISDSGYYIEKIYLKKSYEDDNLYKEIYSKDRRQKNNYRGIINNFSYINNYNQIKVNLKKIESTVKINNKIYKTDIFGIVEIKYFFKGSSYPWEKFEKIRGDIDVYFYER